MKYSHINKVLVSIILPTCFFIFGCNKAPLAIKSAEKYVFPNAVKSAEKYVLPNTVKSAEKYLPKVRSIISAPQTGKEVAYIFGREYPVKATNSALRAGNKFLSAGHELLKSRQQLLNSFDDGKDILFLVGHNDTGNFMLPDGSSISFKEISNVTRGNKIVVLISCNSNDYALPGQIGVSRKIYYDEAYTILNRMLKNLNARTDLDLSNQNYNYTVGEIEKMLQDADKKAYISYRVRKSAPLSVPSIAGGGGSITYFIVKRQTS